MIKKIISFLPSAITCMNLISGIVACTLAFRLGDIMLWGLSGMQWAFVWIGIAAVCDFMDGFAARLLHAYSALGKELDSLSDLVSFGVAPSLLLFNLISGISDAACAVAYLSIFIAVMGALRLARFNVDDRQMTTFIGLPIPANALLWIGVIDWITVHGYPGDVVMSLLIVAGGLLMVSGLRMFSLKFRNLSLRDNFKRYALIVAAVLFVFTSGLAGLAWTILFYILSSVVTSRYDKPGDGN